MGLLGIFKERSYKERIDNLHAQLDEIVASNEDLHKQLDAANTLIDTVGRDLVNDISSVQNRFDALKQDLSDAESSLSQKQEQITTLNKEIKQKKSLIISLDDEAAVQDFGLYEPRFPFASALDYKEALAKIRNTQKELIKSGGAVTGNALWSINGSTNKGAKMVKDLQKLVLRAFNSECDDLVDKVKYTNFDASLKKLYAVADSVSKTTSSSVGIAITESYIDSKVKELRLALEYQIKKQEEKEALRELRAQEREAAKLQREIAEQRKAIYKEQSHYDRALADINRQLLQHPDDPALLEKKSTIENELVQIEKSLTEIDYREANQRAGYVYVISNIGAFGENVYKIGMTRRLDPQERVDELGDASVPFNFDVHAMIFSEDAPALETALHKAFESKKVNMVNTRREFFNVTLDEIKDVVKRNFDKTVEFTDVADATQFRISQKMRSGDDK